MTNNTKYNVKEVKELTDPEVTSWLCPLEIIGIDKSEKEFKGEKYLANVSILKSKEGDYYKIANSNKVYWRKYLFFLSAYGKQEGKFYNLVDSKEDDSIAEDWVWRARL